MRKCKRNCYMGRVITKILIPVILVPLQLLLCLPCAQKTYFSKYSHFFPLVVSRNNSGSSPHHPYSHFSTAVILYLPTKTNKKKKRKPHNNNNTPNQKHLHNAQHLVTFATYLARQEKLVLLSCKLCLCFFSGLGTWAAWWTIKPAHRKSFRLILTFPLWMQ